MMNKKSRTSWALFITVLFLSIFAMVATAQKKPSQSPTFLGEDTAINPHDFTNSYYASRGIWSKLIIDRRTGADLLSVFGESSNPIHAKVRVLATLPAYGPSGELLYWYPLGELNYNGFTDDKVGVIARETALATPLYVFPMNVNNVVAFSFNNMRQAALMGPTENFYSELTGTPIGLRRIVEVRFTAKAFDPSSLEMIKFMLGKNGEAIDGLPLIRSVDDVQLLIKHELIELRTKELWDDGTPHGMFTLSPVIADPTGGAIAPDAFLLMSTRDGIPMPGEQMFATQFGCLRKLGTWCKE